MTYRYEEEIEAGKERRGLVLEGGGLRCMFTAGVLDAMMEGLPEGALDGLVGVSAGALFGCNYKSGQKGRALRYNVLLKDDARYMGWRTLLKTGEVVGSRFAYHVVPFEIDPFDAPAFRQNEMEFWMVTTDIESGEPVYHRMDEFTHHELEWMRASASMPGVARPVALDGRVMLDGGLADSIPLEAFQRMGYGRNIVVLTQPKGYMKKPWRGSWVFRVLCRKYPKVAWLMAHRYEMYNAQLRYLAEQERRGKTLVICPEGRLGIGRTELNEQKMRAIHRQGYEQAWRMMPQIKDFLGV